MLLWLPLLIFFGAFSGAVDLQAAQSEAISTPRTTVRLVTDSDIAIPGSSLGAGLDFELAQGWHVYWRNPGDSGLPPKLNWNLEDGWSAGGIAWPVPERIPVGPFVNFGYSDRVLIADRLQVPANAVLGDSVTLRLDAEWLVCEEECIPEEGSFELQLPIASAAFAAAQEAKHFRATEDLLPREIPGIEASLKSMDDGRLEVRIELPTALPLDPEQIFLFPATESVVEPSAPQQVRLDGSTLVFDLQRSAYAAKTLEGLEGLIVAEAAKETQEGVQEGEEQPLAFSITAAAADAASEGPAAQSLSPNEGRESGGGLPLSLPAALAFAFVGGLLLNLMPCVFPVISIKVLSFLEGAENSARSRRHSWLFALGVLLSFQLLAALLLVLRGAGEEIGWGFHLQSPPVLGLLSLLFFLAGLSFLGVFEVGALVAGRAARLSSGAGLSSGGSGAWSAFGSGALATVVATPCTAPFMGPALGLALVLSPLQALAIFSALGAGMAAPYLLLAHLPQLAQRLPAPGPWMETLKQVLAFPLFATVVWLAWVLAGISGPTGILGLLIALLLAGFGAWFLGRFGAVTAPPRRRRWVFAGAIATVALAVASVIPGVILPATAATTTVGTAAVGEGELSWLDFRPGLVEELRAEGRAVYVDFTAAWCLTCQVNKTVVFSSDEVKETFQQRDIALVRADWTRRNPDITRALSAFGRSGVPLNVYYPPQQDMSSEVPPKVLPTVLTPGLVLAAVAPTQDAS